MRNIAGKKRVRQEVVDFDYLFGKASPRQVSYAFPSVRLSQTSRLGFAADTMFGEVLCKLPNNIFAISILNRAAP
jgi:hypothetical protein